MEFKDIQVGDKVVMQVSRIGKSDYTLAEVTRITNTLVIIGERKFNKKNGIQYPKVTGWARSDYIHPVNYETLQLVEKTELRIMAHKLKTYNYQSLVDDNPELLKEIFEKLIS